MIKVDAGYFIVMQFWTLLQQILQPKASKDVKIWSNIIKIEQSYGWIGNCIRNSRISNSTYILHCHRSPRWPLDNLKT